jgi:1-deoxy-D-xylulose-5-phosphate synthase
VTVEEHSLVGGFGAAVLEAANAQRLDTSTITRLGMPDAWIAQDPRRRQLVEAGLDETAIRRAVLDAIDRRPANPSPKPTLAQDPAERRH